MDVAPFGVRWNKKGKLSVGLIILRYRNGLVFQKIIKDVIYLLERSLTTEMVKLNVIKS